MIKIRYNTNKYYSIYEVACKVCENALDKSKEINWDDINHCESYINNILDNLFDDYLREALNESNLSQIKEYIIGSPLEIYLIEYLELIKNIKSPAEAKEQYVRYTICKMYYYLDGIVYSDVLNRPDIFEMNSMTNIPFLNNEDEDMTSLEAYLENIVYFETKTFSSILLIFTLYLYVLSEIDEIKKQSISQKPRLKYLNAVTPSNYCIPNNKLANTITNDELSYDKKTELFVGGNNKKAIVTTCVLTVDKNINFPNGYRLNENDIAVQDAVSTLYVAGNELITIDMIYRVMTGKVGSSIKAQDKAESIQNSMKKLNGTIVEIDMSEEFKNRKISLNGESIIKGRTTSRLLQYNLSEVSTANKTVTAYKILSTPIIYEYSSSIGQVLTVDINILDVPLDNTDKIIVLKNYLIRRIEGMKGKNKLNNNHINLIKIYEKLDIYGEDKTKKQIEKSESKIREQIKKILDYWKKENYIKEYEFKNLNGRKKDTILIKI